MACITRTYFEEAYLLSLLAAVQSESVATEAVRKKQHMSFVSTCT